MYLNLFYSKVIIFFKKKTEQNHNIIVTSTLKLL